MTNNEPRLPIHLKCMKFSENTTVLLFLSLFLILVCYGFKHGNDCMSKRETKFFSMHFGNCKRIQFFLFRKPLEKSETKKMSFSVQKIKTDPKKKLARFGYLKTDPKKKSARFGYLKKSDISSKKITSSFQAF